MSPELGPFQTCRSFFCLLSQLMLTMLAQVYSFPSFTPCRELVLLVLAASCLHLFAQSNWTGPSVSIALCDLLPPALTAQVEHSICYLCSRDLFDYPHFTVLNMNNKVYT